MTLDIFNEVKQAVTMPNVAQFYGFSPNRAGFICCPFHGEKTPSMKLYNGSGGFHCFGCGVGGSVIDFTARLFNLDAMGAVRRLDADFNLHLPLDRPLSREEHERAQRRKQIVDTHKLFEEWRQGVLRKLNTSYRAGYLALKDKPPDEWTDAEALAIEWMPSLEYWADSLDSGNIAEQMAIFRVREGVTRICQTILSSMPVKSATA